MPNQPLDNNDPLKGKKIGKWTKYGGAISGVVKEAIKQDWYCQTCGQKQPIELKPFLYEIFSGEYIRLCNKCIKVSFTVRSHIRITQIVRKS